MRLCTDKPDEFWSQVWACRSVISQAAQQHRVDTKLLEDQVAREFVAHSFVSYAEQETHWRWSVVLLFCSQVLELMLRLQWQQAMQLISELLAHQLLWRTLESAAATQTVCLQSLLNIFEQLPTQVSNHQVDTLTCDVNYWRPAFVAAHHSVEACYQFEYDRSWFRRVWFGDETRYLARIEQEVSRYDRYAGQRWGWWHWLLGWWKNIDEKRRLLQLKKLEQALAGWTQGDRLPTAEAVDDQLMLGCELGITMKLKELQRLSLQQHQRRGEAMARELLKKEARPNTAHPGGYHAEISERLDQFKKALEEKGCALVSLYVKDLLNGKLRDLADVWQPALDMNKLYQAQLSRLMIDIDVPETERDGYRRELVSCQDGIQKVLLHMVEYFSPHLQRLRVVSESLDFVPQNRSLAELCQHYIRITSYFEQQVRQLYDEVLEKLDAQPDALNAAVKRRLVTEYVELYQRSKETYWRHLEGYETHVAQCVQSFCAEHEEQVLRRVREERHRAHSAESVPGATEVSLQLQEHFLAQLSQVSPLLAEIQPRFVDLIKAKRAFISYQRHCQISLIGLQSQLVNMGRYERALSQYLSANERRLKALSQMKVPILSMAEEYCRTVFQSHHPRQVLAQALAIINQHWDAYAQAEQQWRQLDAAVRIRLTCEVDYRSELTHDAIKDADAVWLHYPRPRNHFLLAYDGTNETWSVLGRDSQGKVHSFELDLQSESWKAHRQVLAHFENCRTRYTPEYYEQVQCYPLLKRLAQELGEPLFEFADAGGQAAYYSGRLGAYLQKELSRVYEKQVLPVLARLYQAKGQLRRARALMTYAHNKCEDNDPLVAESWECLSRSMIASPIAAPALPNNPCREIVPYGEPLTATNVKLDNHATLTPDEQRYESFHRAVFDYLRLFYQVQYNVLGIIREHQCASIDAWYEGVKQTPQLTSDYEALNRHYRQVWRISHPDKIRSELATIHPKARAHFLKMIDKYRKDIQLKNDLIKGIVDNRQGFETYLRQNYILGLDQGYYKSLEYVDHAIYYGQRDWQHYASNLTFKFFKTCVESSERDREARERAEARIRELEAELRKVKGKQGHADADDESETSGAKPTFF